MTTEGKIRDLDTLLALDTYQGMSDDELTAIIDYKERMARLEAVKDALVDAESSKRATLDKAVSDMRDIARSAFQAALANTPDFKSVRTNG